MNYDEAIKSTPTVLVEFYASWCPHCQRMMPIVEQIKELLNGQVDVYQLDIDENKELADTENVESIPTFIVYKNGKEVWRQSGEMEADVLLAHIQRYV
ncbi:MAG: thioredoxin family protein [Muribaculaceae bacterium]|nr:thioredoxin family protein [Muribaculaceae bacterium]